ncbi:MAG: signal recognition particle-docking protein FtsY [Armatimonadota bacterium]
MLKLFSKIGQLLSRDAKVDEALFEELEELLIQADVSVRTSERLLSELREVVRRERIEDGEDVKNALRRAIAQMLAGPETRLRFSDTPPTVFLMVGVNGSGKTTTIAKLASRYRECGMKVLLAAADTFRAAAIDQLETWAQRVDVGIVRHQPGSDPAAVVFDALQAAKSRGVDLLIADTAGRLHTKSNLMEELKKIGRVVEREMGRPPDETLLVLDATTGQNAVNQAREFSRAVPVTGVVLTKLDGTAKGGVLLTVRQELGLPVKLLGVGEKPSDLQDLDPEAFAAGIFAQGD